FFSSRRRHTRFSRDWSSDVCSSDLGIPNLFNPNEKDILEGKIELAKEIALSTKPEGALACVKGMIERRDRTRVIQDLEAKILIKIGRASCRERVDNGDRVGSLQ